MKSIIVLALFGAIVGCPAGEADPPRPAPIPQCAACADQVVIQVIGTCKTCGKETPSSAYLFCNACATKAGVCRACGKALPKATDESGKKK